MASSAVLIFDDELGFLFALSEELGKRAIAAYPARTIKETESLIARLRLKPALLVINCRRRGACAFAEAISKHWRELRIVALVSASSSCRKCGERVVAQLRDPEDKTPERIPHCADVIQDLLRKGLGRTYRALGR
jgi:hypothetical protein